MRLDAGSGAFGVRRPHPHAGMIGGGAHTVRNRAGELLLARRCGQDGKHEKATDQKLHRIQKALA